MFQMTKKYSILATFLFCALVFVACGDSDSSSFIDKGTEPQISPKDTVSSDSSAQDSVEKEPVEKDSSTQDTAESHTSYFDESGLHTFILGDSLGQLLYGELNLDYPVDSVLTLFEIGDIVNVAIVSYDTLEMVVAESANDVPIAGFVLVARSDSEHPFLSVHNGQLASILGITDVKTPIEVTISMKEKGGFLFGLEMRYAQYLDTYTENYPDLSIEEFANFREVRTTGMGENKLYRSSSPIDNCLGRNLYADSLAKEAGVTTFINLTDSEDYAKSYKGFETTYYSTQDVIYLAVAPDFYSRAFKDGMVKGLRFMIEHEGPYLVHCIYGMDRTGFMIAVLEALMGAKTEEIQADYAKTFTNYFNVVNGLQVTYNEQQAEFFENVVVRNLRAVYHADGIEIPDADDIDWSTPTEQFLKKQGMTDEEISALKDRLK